jgi:histidinol phosphatase-like enzyme
MEIHGGDLVEQCRMRDIKQVYICPHHPEMDFAEG